MKTQHKHPVAPRLAILLAMLALPVLTPAQTAVQQTDPPDIDLVILPTFEVVTDKDIGYIAVDSFAGGRMSTPIKLTPSAMSSLTRTFIDDVSVTNMRDALRWTLNVTPSDLNAGKSGTPFNGWDYNFRGAGQSIQGGSGPTRNYFSFYQVADTYNVDRIELDRGPNSILFGVGTIGGVLNVYTKQPRPGRDFVTVAATLDTNSAWRLEADINKGITPKLTARLNVLFEDDRDWRNNGHNKQNAIDLALSWQIAQRTRLRVDAEASESRNTIIQSVFGDDTMHWDGVTVANAAGDQIPDTVGITRQGGWGGNSYWVYQPGNPGAGIQNYLGSYRTTGYGLRYAPYSGFYKGAVTNSNNEVIQASEIPVMPSQDFTYGSGLSEQTYANFTAWFEHQFTRNLDLVLSFYRYTDNNESRDYEGIGSWSIDVNRELPDGTPNPNFGKRYGDFFLSMQRQARGVTEGRVQLNWQFDASPLKQRFSVSAATQEINWSAWQNLALTTTNPDSVWQNNLIWARFYFDNPNVDINLPSSISGMDTVYRTLMDIQNWFDFDETHRLNNMSAVSHSRLWDDHLSVIAGVRYDDYSYTKHNRNIYDTTRASAHDTTYSLGAVYYLHRLPWLGVFANHSRNFDPINPGRSPKLDGSPLGAAKGKGYDYGIRISTPDGKYYASLSRYHGESSGRATSQILNISGFWRSSFKAQGLSEQYDPALANLLFSDTEAIKLKGYEFEVTANPLPSLRIMASLALPESEIADAMADQRAYFAQHLPEWQQAIAAGLAQPSGSDANNAATTLQNDLNNAQIQLDNNLAGRDQPGLVKYTANVFANYTFLKGPMKGFSAGAGATMLGKQYLTTIRDRKYYADSRLVTNLVLAYTTKIFGKETRFALSIDNVLNDRDAVITSFDGGWRYADDSAVPNGYFLVQPITFRLSARVTF